MPATPGRETGAGIAYRSESVASGESREIPPEAAKCPAAGFGCAGRARVRCGEQSGRNIALRLLILADAYNQCRVSG